LKEQPDPRSQQLMVDRNVLRVLADTTVAIRSNHMQKAITIPMARIACIIAGSESLLVAL